MQSPPLGRVARRFLRVHAGWLRGAQRGVRTAMLVFKVALGAPRSKAQPPPGSPAEHLVLAIPS